jgi:hypothetical protein
MQKEQQLQPGNPSSSVATGSSSNSSNSSLWSQLAAAQKHYWGRLLYNYYNWRHGTTGDLKLTVGLFGCLILLGSSVKRWAVDDPELRNTTSFWSDMYQVWCFWRWSPQLEACSGLFRHALYSFS